MALFAVAMLLTTACAGSVGKYRNAATARNLTAGGEPGDVTVGGLDESSGLGVSGGGTAA